jgi:hypothetical protein
MITLSGAYHIYKYVLAVSPPLEKIELYLSPWRVKFENSTRGIKRADMCWMRASPDLETIFGVRLKI